MATFCFPTAGGEHFILSLDTSISQIPFHSDHRFELALTPKTFLYPE